jgi:hypothetical protein
MDNGSVAEIAGGGSDIAINTLSSSSATGGGSATFNGSAYRFTLSAPPSVSAQQLLVSINGVIQKPVAGTGQPSEGFSVDGTDIILGDAPATGSDFFILTFKSLGVSEPADNSVTSAKIVDGAIVNADINASAAIAGSKISPSFTSSIGVTTNNPNIRFDDSDTNNNGEITLDNTQLRIEVDEDDAIGSSAIKFRVDGSDKAVINSSGNVGLGTSSPTFSGFGSNTGGIEISDVGSGANALLVQTGSNEFFFANTSNANYIYGADNAPLIISTNGSERMRIDSSGNVQIPNDSVFLQIGAGQDLDLHHNGTNSYIRNKTGNLHIRPLVAEEGIILKPNGAVELYHDNSKKLETTSSGATVTGSLNMGTELNMTEGVAATRSIDAFVGDAGTFRIRGTNSGDSSGHQVLAEFRRNAGVHLNHSGSTRFETTSEGVSISGSVSGNAIENATLRFNILNSSGAEKKAQIISTKVSDISSTIEFGTTVSHSYAERMRIHSNGFVGIGTAAPVRRLHLHNDSSTSNYLQVTNSTTGTTTTDGVLFGLSSQEEGLMWNFESTNLKFATANTERMRIDSDGDVLVGLTTALSTQAGSIQAAGPIIAKSYINNHTSNATVVEYINNISKIRAYGATSGSGVLVFNTGGGGDSADTERMRITSSGDIGIGTTSPAQRLEIKDNSSNNFGSGIRLSQGYNSVFSEIASNFGGSMTLNAGQGTTTAAMHFQVNDDEKMRLTHSGKLGIGTTSPSAKIHVDNGGSGNVAFLKHASSGIAVTLTLQNNRATGSIAGEQISFLDDSGTQRGKITNTTSSTTYATSSDYRLKENEVLISDGIERIKKFKPYKFNWKHLPNKIVDGFFAHEVENLVEDCVDGTKDRVVTKEDHDKGDYLDKEIGTEIHQMMDHSKLVPLIVAALKEAIGRIEVLEAK